MARNSKPDQDVLLFLQILAGHLMGMGTDIRHVTQRGRLRRDTGGSVRHARLYNYYHQLITPHHAFAS